MSAHYLTKEARLENALMLASTLGLKTEDADEALQFDIVATFEPNDTVATEIANEFAALLRRTIRNVHLNHSYDSATLEIVIGRATPRSPLKKLFLTVSSEMAVISDDASGLACEPIPGVFVVLVACYLSGAALQKVFKGDFPYGGQFPIQVQFAAFGLDRNSLTKELDLGVAYLAGAGAIGNGLLWALRHLHVRGELNIADDDVVSSGNLNRQIWFTKDDIGKPKAEQLALLAQPAMSALKLIPRKHRIQDLAERSEEPWLKRLIIAVDSRRARRALQKEFPGEVFDASTTDIREVVLHYNKQPTNAACLSCIYESDEEELSREAHIAEHLGVTVAEVRSERITGAAADKILARYPQLEDSSLVGLAYDTLFKRLCGQGELKTLEGRRVVAPFAFVSALAGALLALELVRRLGNGSNRRDFNYWRISPWHSPMLRRQLARPKQFGCEFCGNETLVRVNQLLWPQRSEQD